MSGLRLFGKGECADIQPVDRSTHRAICSCDRASWAKREEKIPTRCNNIDVYCQFQMLITDYSLNMFRTSLCPSSGEKDHVLLHMVFVLVVLDVAGCGSVVLTYVVGCEHCEGCCSSSNLHVSDIFMPIIRRKRPRITAYGVCAGSVGCGWLRFCGVTL